MLGARLRRSRGVAVNEDRPGKKSARRRQPLKATSEALERSALHYLERYDCSSGHLRRLLARKIAISARVHGTDPEEGRAAAERLIARLADTGILDDARYARVRIRGLLARGTSDAMIRARLRAKQVPPDLIDAALKEAIGTDPAHELAAALRYARRRRLGPFRLCERAERRERDLAALGRQGFDYETARRIIDCSDPQALEADAGGG